MDDIMTSIKELRKTLDGKIESCITKEKAEKLVEDVINRLHPSASKAVLPSSESDVLERYSAFKRKSSVAGEETFSFRCRKPHFRKSGRADIFLSFCGKKSDRDGRKRSLRS